LNRAERRRLGLTRAEARRVEGHYDPSDWFKWYYYSTYHPAWNPEVVLADFRAGVSLREAYLVRGLPWPPAPTGDPFPPATDP
jgi:hypothetical protein